MIVREMSWDRGGVDNWDGDGGGVENRGWEQDFGDRVKEENVMV